MDAARVILEARLRAALTQEEVARRTGMAVPAVSRLERGAVRPRIDTLERLLRVCGYAVQADPRLGANVDREPIRRALEVPERLRLPRWTVRPLRFLRGHRVRFLVTGAAAARLHGAPVHLRALEIVALADRMNRRRLRIALRKLRVRTSDVLPPLRWRGTQYLDIDRGRAAIWWPQRRLPPYEMLWRPAREMAVESFAVPVVCLDDLIRINLEGPRRDRAAAELLAAVREEVDALSARSGWPVPASSRTRRRRSSPPPIAWRP